MDVWQRSDLCAYLRFEVGLLFGWVAVKFDVAGVCVGCARGWRCGGLCEFSDGDVGFSSEDGDGFDGPRGPHKIWNGQRRAGLLCGVSWALWCKVCELLHGQQDEVVLHCVSKSVSKECRQCVYQ